MHGLTLRISREANYVPQPMLFSTGYPAKCKIRSKNIYSKACVLPIIVLECILSVF